jgi:predicted dehydrogenase
MTSSRTNRRGFLGAAAATGAVPFVPWTTPAFANESATDRPLIGCIGLGGMGMGDARGHAAFGDIVAVCDVDARHAARAREDEKIGRGKADAYGDYRRVLDRPDIDVVSIVTTDHWHVKIAIEALQAGKHVFIQKPLSLTLEENRLARAAAEKHPKLQFFIGTQQRSDRDRFLRAVNMVHKGLLGDIRKVTVGINGGPKGGPFSVAEVPKELDWDMWLGQAPKVDYRPQRCHGNFRWWYDYSGGKFTDWGAHHVDIAQWALREDQKGKGPVVIDGTDAHHPVPFKDGYPTVDDSYNTSHDFAVNCRFPGGVEMIVTSRGDNGILFEGTKGKMFVNRGKITGTPIDEQWDKDVFGDADLSVLYKGKPYEGHKQNFFRCVREGGLPVSDVFSHVIAMNTCHLAAIAARLGRKIGWDPAAETIVGDEQAASFMARRPRSGFEIPRV